VCFTPAQRACLKVGPFSLVEGLTLGKGEKQKNNKYTPNLPLCKNRAKKKKKKTTTRDPGKNSHLALILSFLGVTFFLYFK
jgi:hypothetical protein